MSRLKPPPRHAPKRLKTTADLLTLQRLMTHAIVRPLAPGDRSPKQWIDGRRTTAAVIGEFIKPNAELTAVERIQIYHRVYWYRLIGAATDDCPGLQALLGEKKFQRTIRAYLAKYPSRSFTLRNLCSRLPQFLKEEPRWTRPRTALALAIARFEWAQTEAFDGPSLVPLSPAEIQRTPPNKLKVSLQPYLSLMELSYPVDTYVLAVKDRNALRSESSNTSGLNVTERKSSAGSKDRVAERLQGVSSPNREGELKTPKISDPQPKPLNASAPRAPKPAKTYLAVHRYENRLYYKRLDRPQYRILLALRAGKTIPQALAAGGRRIRPEEVQEWFALWMKLGWLCRRIRRAARKSAARK